MIGCNVVVPDSDGLIQTIFLGADILKDGKSGSALTKSICDCLVNHGIKPSQLPSFVFDGAYIKSHVDEELRKEFDHNADQVPVWWVWLHVCGLSDKHENNEKGEKVKKLQWVAQLCFLCSQLYNRFNMGNYYEKLVAASEDTGIDFFALVNLSDTRFANSKRFVFLNVLRMLPAIIRVLETDIARAEANKHQLEASDPYV